jgi:1,2-phenylacetyl-CoA epoxidase PaaB subunit
VDRTITEVRRCEYERVLCKINRDTGEVKHIQKMHPLALYVIRYNTPRSKGNSFNCRAKDEADAVAQAHENFARIDAGIHIRDVKKKERRSGNE